MARSALATRLLPVLLLLPMPALAICIFTWPWSAVQVYPREGTLPLSPDLYVFTPGERNFPLYRDRASLIVEDVLGRRIPTTVHKLPTANPADEVYRIELRATDPGPIRLYYVEGNKRTVLAHYTVSDKALPPVTGPADVLRQGASIHDGCPTEITRDLYLSVEAPAYRVTYADTREDYLAGRTESVVVPARSDTGFDTLSSARPPPGQGLAPLGELPCEVGGRFRTWGPPAYVGISALRADGTETPLPAEPTYVEPPLSR